MAENTKRKEKFQGLLAYFEKFSRTPKKSKVKTPKKTKVKSTPKSSKKSTTTPSKSQIDKENLGENTPATPLTPLAHPTTVSTPDIPTINKERVFQSPSYDSDNSYKNHEKKKRRQSFSSVRVTKKAPRRMTLIGCEISPVLLVCCGYFTIFTITAYPPLRIS